MKPYKRPNGGTPGPPVMYEKPSDPGEEGAGYGHSNDMSQQEYVYCAANPVKLLDPNGEYVLSLAGKVEASKGVPAL